MAAESSSYRRILKSTSIIGGATFGNIAIGLLRSKVVALLLGPTGIGIAGLYNSLIGSATSLSTLGLGTVGTRQIAEAAATEDLHTLKVARRALFWGTLFLACAGGLVVWSLRGVLAVHVFGNAAYSTAVGWLALGVALSVAGASQAAVIQGMRRIADIARLSIIGSAVSTVLGITVIWRWGQTGLVAYVLVVPLVAFIVGHIYVARLPGLPKDAISLQELRHEWAMLLRLGFAMTGAGLAQSFAQLWIRSDVARVLGAGALGQYQAAWIISMQYVGLVLNAMGTDYYPRLTGIIGDTKAAAQLVNEQTEVALLVSAPVFLGIISLAPWIVHLLYAPSFSAAGDILRWQVLGDVLKVASWPLGFVILARGDGKTFFWTETMAWVILSGLIAGLVPVFGLAITGISYPAMYVVYLPVMYFLVRRRFEFQWSRPIWILFSATLAACIGMDILGHLTRLSEPVGVLAAAGFAVLSLARISHKGDMGGMVGRFGASARRLMERFGI